MTDHVARLDRVLTSLPADDAAWLLRLVPAWLLGRYRRHCRDEAIRAAGQLLSKPGNSTYAVGCDLERRLNRYIEVGGWKRNQQTSDLPDGADPVLILLHQIARTNEGKSLGWLQIKRVLDGERTPLS